jgi:hypothetical protein
MFTGSFLEHFVKMTEVKKEAFRKYLESAGAIDSITKVLVALYEEPDRPANATEFLKSALGAPTLEEHQKLLADNKRLTAELAAAKEEIAELKQIFEARKTQPDE